MENNEVFNAVTNEEIPDAAPSAEPTCTDCGRDATLKELAAGLAIVDFTAEELRMVVVALVAAGEDMRDNFPIHQSMQDRAGEYLNLALRLDNEYSDAFYVGSDED